MMPEDEKLTQEEKEQLINAVQGTLEILTNKDYLAIYDVLLDACRREKAELAERMMIECVNGDEE